MNNQESLPFSSNSPSNATPQSAAMITQWLEEAKKGIPAALDRLCQHYLNNLVAFAKNKMKNQAVIRAYDGEDAALSALNSFCEGVEKGKFKRLQNRKDIWQILTVIIRRKIIDRINYEMREKRGSGKVRSESVFQTLGEDNNKGAGIDSLKGPDLSPDLYLDIVDEVNYLLGKLEDPLRDIAAMRLKGYSNKEIASEKKCAERTIERKLSLIRKIWQQALEEIQK